MLHYVQHDKMIGDQKFSDNLSHYRLPVNSRACTLIGWKVSDRLLEMFAVKIDLTVLLFGSCIVAVLAIVTGLSVVLVHRAGRTNPTENLRSE